MWCVVNCVLCSVLLFQLNSCFHSSFHSSFQSSLLSGLFSHIRIGGMKCKERTKWIRWREISGEKWTHALFIFHFGSFFSFSTFILSSFPRSRSWRFQSLEILSSFLWLSYLLVIYCCSFHSPLLLLCGLCSRFIRASLTHSFRSVHYNEPVTKDTTGTKP